MRSVEAACVAPLAAELTRIPVLCNTMEKQRKEKAKS